MDRIAYIIGQTFIFWSSIVLALAALVAVCWFLGLYLSRSGNILGGFLTVPFAFVLSLVLSRLVHWYCRSDSYASFQAAMTDFTTGGYALVGVFAGCVLTACLLRLLQAVKNLPQLLDCMCLAGAAGISVGRLASLFNSSDRGDIVEGITQLPLVFPVANSVTGALEYRLATFMLQALVTGGIFILLLIFWIAMKRKGKNGDTCLMFMMLYGAAQAVFDSTRYDSLYLRSNGFVSMVQIVAAVALVVAFVILAVRMCRARGFRFWYLAFWLPALGLLGCAGYMEYYVQRHGNESLFAYTVMSGCLIGVILIGIATYVLAVVGEAVKAKNAAAAALVFDLN